MNLLTCYALELKRERKRDIRRLDAIIVDIDGVDRYYVYGWSGVHKCRDYVESNIAFNLDSLEPGSLVEAQEETNINRLNRFTYEVDEYFYHDMESYGTVWFQKLNLPGVPETRYYSQFKVLRRERKHLVVQDMDIPVGNRASSGVWFRPVDMLWLANRTIPEKGVRISRELIRSKKIKQP